MLICYMNGVVHSSVILLAKHILHIEIFTKVELCGGQGLAIGVWYVALRPHKVFYGGPEGPYQTRVYKFNIFQLTFSELDVSNLKVEI